MGYRLGIDLGTSFTAATIGRAGSMATAALEAGCAIVPSAVYIGTDGERLYGSAAAERSASDPGRVLRGFVRRIGDQTPMLPGERTVSSAHRLAADFVNWIVAQASEQEGARPAAVAVTHPGTWGPHKRELLLSALTSAGVPNPTLVAEPVAAAIGGTATAACAPGTTVAVYDLGGRTFDAALVRLGDGGTWTMLGRPAGLPDLGGADLDDAILAHVIASLTPDAQRELTAALSAENDLDEATAAGMAALRLECVRVKEALSTETTASVAVELPGATTSVRLTRSELETLVAPTLEATLDVLDAVLAGAGVKPADLHSVLVSGGSSRMPLVTQLLSRQFGVPVLSAGGANPATAVAAGAVLALDTEPTRPLAAPVVLDAPAPAPIAQPVATSPAAAMAMAEAPATQVAMAETPAGSKPIRPRRSNRRAGIMGLEGLQPVARATEAAPVEGPLAVVPARTVRSVDALLTQPAPRGAVALATRPSATVVAEPILRAHTPALTAEDRMPARPALVESGFETHADLELYLAESGPWTWRSVFSVRRTVALSTLTVAIFCGATAWVPATPAITQSSTTTLQVASGEHHTTP